MALPVSAEREYDAQMEGPLGAVISRGPARNVQIVARLYCRKIHYTRRLDISEM